MMNFVVQASSRNWAGAVEHCMNEIDGFPAVYWTIKNIYDNFTEANIIVAAPEYDAQGDLNQLTQHFPEISIIYAHDASPLLRMIQAAESINNAHFIRLNALNFQIEASFINEIYALACRGDYDCVKFPDDYPVHFTCEVYKSSALIKLKDILASGEINSPTVHEIHPKFLLMRQQQFNSQYYQPSDELDVNKIKKYRTIMEQVMFSERQIVSEDKKILSGDQLTYHYDLAETFLKNKQVKSGSILDIACGTGYGAKKFSGKGFNIVGADYDHQQIEENKALLTQYKDIEFEQQDITKMSFATDTFDIVLSMETIEHVEPHSTLKELKRVIKTDGYLILSTPQNSCSSICVNPQHLYEYSLKELTELVSQYFTIEKVIGLKAGKIHFDDDPIGANTILFARNNA